MRNAAREVSRALPDASPELDGRSGPTSGQPIENTPTTPQLEEHQQRRGGRAPAGDEDEWTDRAGMVAQQRSAMENSQAARDDREQKAELEVTQRAEAHWQARHAPAEPAGVPSSWVERAHETGAADQE